MSWDWSISSSSRKTRVYIIITCITILASYLQYRSPIKSFDSGPPRYTRYNNYVIFKQSHFHLLDHKNMFILYPEEHHDLYKYSPAFALVFGVFAWMPNLLGLTLWNLLNVWIVLFALMRPEAKWRDKLGLFLLFCIPELVLSTQHAQSNALMTGLLILSYFDLEQDRPGRAAIWVVLSAFIKIYAGLGGLLLFLFIYADNSSSGGGTKSPTLRLVYIRNYIITAILATVFLLLVPLCVVSPSSLLMQYQGWWQMLVYDHDTSYGLSLMHILNLIFPYFHGKTYLQLAGVLSLVVLLYPLSKFKDSYLRLEYLAAILLALIIFNHKSESATFIVAVIGIGIWYFSKPKPSWQEHSILIASFIFTVLIATDLFPPGIKRQWLVPYGVKVWACILIYGWIVKDLILNHKQTLISKAR